MTNATDVLCVGGPANGRMFCLNRNNIGFPSPLDVTSISEPAGTVSYPVRKWWHPELEQWYWIAARDVDGVEDGDIVLEVALQNFQPAWDLRDLPAPEVENGT